MRLFQAIKAFWNTLIGKIEEPKPLIIKATNTPMPKPAENLAAAPAVPAAAPEALKTTDRKALAKSSKEQFDAGAVYTLVLLQREGRLVDFMMENIDSYDDAQVGAAVRRIHQSCQKALSDYFKLKKIIDAREGAQFKVDAKVDRAKVRLIGNVPDMLPFDGFVQHPGWEAAKVELPDRNDGIDAKIICPAEVGF